MKSERNQSGSDQIYPSDQELLDRVAENDSQAMELLLTRYKGLVRSKAAAMYMAGADAEDVIQEGMIGLFKAIRDYNPEHHVPFAAFAAYCIMAQITDAVRQASRKKHQLLNQSISLQSLTPMADSDNDLPMSDHLGTSASPDPEQELMNQENMADLTYFIQQNLSPLERQSVLLFLQDLSYMQIAGCLNIPVKTVDNALRRARKKFMAYREQADQIALKDKEHLS